MDTAVAWLSERYTVFSPASVGARTGFLAGNDATRAGSMLDAVRDPTIRALFATRGGHGALRLLEEWGPSLADALAADPKPIVGFSDITALHGAWSRAGVASIHGAMLAALGRGAVSALDRDTLVAALEGGVSPAWEGLSTLAGGSARGPAAGGNLAVLAAMLGTPWMPELRGRVVFLEDIAERPYRVDRMLTSLRASGALRGVAAVVLGEFVDCEPGPDGVTILDVLRERVGSLGVPVLAGGPFGHGARIAPVVFGAPVHVADGRVEFGARP